MWIWPVYRSPNVPNSGRFGALGGHVCRHFGTFQTVSKRSSQNSYFTHSGEYGRRVGPGALLGPQPNESRIICPSANFRFEDLLILFQGLSRFEVVDLSPSLLEPLVERILRRSELSQGRPGILTLPIDDRHIPVGRTLEPHLLPTYAEAATGSFVLLPTGPADLLEDGLGLVPLAGLDGLCEAIDGHGVPPYARDPYREQLNKR